MATIEDVATNQDMVNIANAIRRVTRTAGKMTIPQMPERLMDIQVALTENVTIDFSTGNNAVLGTFDNTIKHLFIVTPNSTADAILLAKVKAELGLIYDETNGILSVSFARPRADANAVSLKIVDILISQENETSGFLVNQGTGGGAGIAEPYSDDREYELGETFLYNNNFGITIVAHNAEEYNTDHNIILANQILSGDEYKDLAYYVALLNDKVAEINNRIDSEVEDLATAIEEQGEYLNGRIDTKFDANKVKTEYSNKQDEVYSTQYANNRFAPLSLAQSFFARKDNTTNAILQKEQPTPASTNILTTTSTNTDYNWNAPDFRLKLTTTNGITLSSTNMFNVSLPFRVDRDSNISFGAKVRVSTNNGDSWSYISSAQAYGAEDFSTQVGNTYEFAITLDLLSELTTYPIGTIFELEIYKKQAISTPLTTTVYCGVEQDGAIINTTVQFILANVNINTSQLEDGSVTTSKIADNAVTQEKIANNSITTDKIIDNSINSDKLADNSVTTNKIANNNITYNKLEQSVKDILYNALLKPENPTDNVLTYIDPQGVQHFIGIDPRTMEIVENRLSAGIELVEV